MQLPYWVVCILFFQDDFVRVRKSNLEKLTTEVMQLKEFLPKVLNRDLIETVAKARAAQAGMLPLIRKDY